ncbi:MAG: hypothetical protein AAFN12_09735 [Cyanobacteria bacterium J06560_2]
MSPTISCQAPLQRRRGLVQKANRYLLRNLGVKNRSIEEVGVLPSVKRFSYDYVTDLQIDPNAPEGLRRLENSITASFSKHR